MQIPRGAALGHAGKRFQSAPEALPQTKVNKPHRGTDPAPSQDGVQASPIPSLQAEKGQDSTTTQPGHVNFPSMISAATAQFSLDIHHPLEAGNAFFYSPFSIPGFAFSHHLRCRDGAEVWLGFHQSEMGKNLEKL